MTKTMIFKLFEAVIKQKQKLLSRLYGVEDIEDATQRQEYMTKFLVDAGVDESVADIYITAVEQKGAKKNDFMRLLLSLDTNTIRDNRDKFSDLWIMYDNGSLPLNKDNGVIDPLEVYGKDDLYKMSDEDFEYIVNAVSIVNTKGSLKNLGIPKSLITPEKIKSLFIKRGRLLSKEEIFNNIDSLSEEAEKYVNNIDSKDDDKLDSEYTNLSTIIGKKLSDMSPESATKAVVDIILKPAFNSNQYKNELDGKIQDDYEAKLLKIFKDSDDTYELLSLKQFNRKSKETAGVQLVKYIDKIYKNK